MEKYSAAISAMEVRSRIEKLQSVMQEKGINGSLVIQNTDFYYFSATSQQGWLYIPEEGKPVLMIFKDYDRARSESPLEDVVSLVSPKKIPEILLERGLKLPLNLGMELDVLPTNLFFQYQKIFNTSQIIDVSTEIRLLRAVKSEYEISSIRVAAEGSDLLDVKVKELLEPGKTELMVAGELEGYARSIGHQGLIRMRLFNSELFWGHLLSGADAAIPSYLASPTGGAGVNPVIAQGAGHNVIGKNEPIVVDYTYIHNGYISDQTRVFSLGEVSYELRKAHEAMVEIQEYIKDKVCPGVVSGDIYDWMVSLAEKKGYEKNFMGATERKIRFTGHGVGLELDEFPFIAKGQKLEIEKNMTIAFEPKVIFPGKGVVGIENTHLVTDGGLEKFSKFDDRLCVITK